MVKKTYGSLARLGDLWIIDAQPHVHVRAKRIFGKLGNQHRLTLSLKHNDETAFELAWFIERYPLTMSDADQAILRATAQAHADYVAAIDEVMHPDYVPPTFDLAKPPRSYQSLTAAIYLRARGLLVGDDVGLGKTVTGIATFMNPRTLPAVVVCPAHLPSQWAEKIAEFAPSLTVHILKKSTPYDLPRVNGRGPDVVISSYHKLSGWSKALSGYCKSVVFDEVHELRHSDSQRYQAAAALAGAMDFRMGLSATPIYNLGGEIYNPIEVLRPGALGTSDEFHREWCGYKGKLNDPRAFGTYLRDNALMVRTTRKQAGRELPRLIRIPTYVDADQQSLHRIEGRAAELAKIILSQAGPQQRGGAFEAAREFSMLMRMATGVAKAPFVADYVRMVAETDERVVLFGWHRQVYDIWQRRLLDLNPVFYTGTETPARKEWAKQQFIEGRSRVLIISLRSGAGLDGLQHVCSQVVIGELDWSPSAIEQCIGRVYRDGQEHPVAAHFVLTDDGSDPVMASRLDLKSEQLNGIRNPDAEFLEELEADPDHIKTLAAAFLKKHGHQSLAEAW